MFLQRRTRKSVKNRFLNIINTAINRGVNDAAFKYFEPFYLSASGGTVYP